MRLFKTRAIFKFRKLKQAQSTRCSQLKTVSHNTQGSANGMHFASGIVFPLSPNLRRACQLSRPVQYLTWTNDLSVTMLGCTPSFHTEMWAQIQLFRGHPTPFGGIVCTWHYSLKMRESQHGAMYPSIGFVCVYVPRVVYKKPHGHAKSFKGTPQNVASNICQSLRTTLLCPRNTSYPLHDGVGFLKNCKLLCCKQLWHGCGHSKSTMSHCLNWVRNWKRVKRWFLKAAQSPWTVLTKSRGLCIVWTIHRRKARSIDAQ